MPNVFKISCISLSLHGLTSHSDYYRPQRSCGQGNIFIGVCLSTGGGGGCLPQCMLGCHTPHPPGWRAPPGWRTPPLPGSRLQHTVYERPVRILLECILVGNNIICAMHISVHNCDQEFFIDIHWS